MVLVNDEICKEGEGKTKYECPQQHFRKHEHDQQGNNENTSRSAEDNMDVFLKLLLDVPKRLGHRVKQILYFILIDLEVNKILDRSAKWCVQHPQIAMFLLAAGLIASLPILILMAFVLSTIVMTFTGFLVLEGTLLTLITMIMFGLLGALGVVLLFFTLVGLATYIAASHFCSLQNSAEIR